jgi:transcriptional regulator with XRE-family HTH domain
MKLAKFMQMKNLDDAGLAKLLDKDRVTVNRYRRGKKIPSASTIVRIAEISGGLVTANDLLGIRSRAGASAD